MDATDTPAPEIEEVSDEGANVQQSSSKPQAQENREPMPVFDSL